MVIVYPTQFSSTLPLSDNLAYTRYILPERSADKENIKHHKSTLTDCTIWGVNFKKNMHNVFKQRSKPHLWTGNL